MRIKEAGLPRGGTVTQQSWLFLPLRMQ